MNLRISARLELALVTSAAFAIVVSLRPDTIEFSEAPRTSAASVAAGRTVAQKRIDHGEFTWRRARLPEPEASMVPPPQTAGVVPPLPTQANSTAGAGLTSPLPPSPSETAGKDQPDIVYLGRMIRNDRTQLFLSSHGQTLVVGEGDSIDGGWLVQSVTSASATLQNAGSGTTRTVAIDDSAAVSPTGVKTVQIGPRFVASAPGQDQAAN